MATKSSLNQTTHICCSCHRRPSIPNSHAIPRSFFRKISRENSGKFIIINDGADPARNSVDISKAHILCTECEKVFDVKFDRPIIDAVRKIRSAYEGKKKTIVLDDSTAVRRSLASILWRCSKSSSQLYSAFKPNQEFEALLETDWRGEGEFCLAYKLDTLIDSVPFSQGGLSSKDLEMFILPPRLHSVSHGYKARAKRGVGTIFVMGGVVVTALAPRPSKTRERQSGYMRTDSGISLKGADIWEIPFVKEFLHFAVHKERMASIGQGQNHG
jgi:hypothetical protein